MSDSPKYPGRSNGGEPEWIGVALYDFIADMIIEHFDPKDVEKLAVRLILALPRENLHRFLWRLFLGELITDETEEEGGNPP